jgi:hypothetical protein
LLQLLWNAVPDILCENDPVLGLKPFMLAASGKYHEEATEQIDASQIETMYPLLWQSPEAIFA